VALTLEYVPVAVQAPRAAIPAQPTSPTEVVSLTGGCDAPLDALKQFPVDHQVSCHPCDEAIVRLLLSRGRHADTLKISSAVAPGTLVIG
jgi:hypothetical protein